MDDVRGTLVIRNIITFKGFDGEMEHKEVVLCTIRDITQQQAKGCAMDWRGMNGPGSRITWTANSLNLS